MMTNKTLLAKAGGPARTFLDQAPGALLVRPSFAPSAEQIHAPTRCAIANRLA